MMRIFRYKIPPCFLLGGFLLSIFTGLSCCPIGVTEKPEAAWAVEENSETAGVFAMCGCLTPTHLWVTLGHLPSQLDYLPTA